MTEVERLNKWLEKFGRSITGQVIYRLVWSNRIFEHRFGTFRDFTDSGLFIHEVKEVRYVRKYNYINERWIFEKWAPGNLTAHQENPDAMNGDYIPVYVFEDSKRRYLSPNEKSLKFIIDFMHGQIKQDAEIPQELIDAKEVEYIVDSMGDHPDFSTFGEIRNAIGYTKGLKGV